MFDIRPLMRLKETYPVPVRIPLADRIAHARRIHRCTPDVAVAARIRGHPTFEAEAALRIYVSSLEHLLARGDGLREPAFEEERDQETVLG